MAVTSLGADIEALQLATDGVTKTGDTTRAAGSDWILDAAGSGSKLGTAANQKLGLWGATPVIQPSASGEGVGGAGLISNAVSTNVFVTNTSNFNGNTGNTTYTINDIVKNLKLAGILATG